MLVTKVLMRVSGPGTQPHMLRTAEQPSVARPTVISFKLLRCPGYECLTLQHCEVLTIKEATELITDN